MKSLLTLIVCLCVVACSDDDDASKDNGESTAEHGGAGGKKSSAGGSGGRGGHGGAKSGDSDADAGTHDSDAKSDERAGGGKSGKGGQGGSGARAAGSGGSKARGGAGGSDGKGQAGSSVTIDADGGIDTEGALMGMGSCCVTHGSAGCTNGELQACVCAKLPKCCTETWTMECVDFVLKKNCEPGVRDCVCGTGDNQWQQTDCCEKSWSDTCDSVAENKCGATHGCF
jgi:hypothetical protein